MAEIGEAEWYGVEFATPIMFASCLLITKRMNTERGLQSDFEEDSEDAWKMMKTLLFLPPLRIRSEQIMFFRRRHVEEDGLNKHQSKKYAVDQLFDVGMRFTAMTPEINRSHILLFHHYNGVK